MLSGMWTGVCAISMSVHGYTNTAFCKAPEKAWVHPRSHFEDTELGSYLALHFDQPVILGKARTSQGLPLVPSVPPHDPGGHILM